jgi:hypothetical protein
MKRTFTTLLVTLAASAAGSAFAGNPNPTLGQDPYWDLPDQGAAWSTFRAEQAKAAARKAAERAQQPATKRVSDGAGRG